MAGGDKLRPVRKYAEFRVADAARNVQLSSERMRGVSDKISLLQSYIEEYERQFAAVAAGGVSMAQLKAHHGFVGQLKQALDSQHLVLHRLTAEHAAVIDAWQRESTKLKLLDNLRDRHAREQEHKQEKNRQREIDDRRRNGR